MAGGPVLSSTAKTYNAKMTGYTWFVCILGGCGGLLLGYDNGVIGGVVGMADFTKKFFPDVYEHEQAVDGTDVSPYCKYDDQVLQFVVSCLYISAAIAGFLATSIARKYGRRVPLFISGVFFFAGAAVQAGAVNIAMVVVGRVLLGVGVGIASLVMPIYNNEVAPPHMRGAMNILFQLNVTIGILAAGLINYGASYIHPWGWRLSLGLAAVPAVIVMIGGLVLPDSPTSLITRGYPTHAREVLQRFRGTKDVDEEYNDIAEETALAGNIKRPFRNLFSRLYRPQLIISSLFMFFQQFTGINAIVFYAPVLFSSIGQGHTAALLNTAIIGAVNVLATVVAVVLVDKVGRKALLIAGGVQMIIAEIVVGVTLKYMFDQYGAELPKSVSWGVLAVICVFIAGFAWSWGPIGWLYPTEIQPLETRAAGASVNVAANMLFTFVIGQSFLTMLCSMEWGVFLFFAAIVVIMVLWTIAFLPETKGMPNEKVFRLFGNHWFWKRYSKGVADFASIPVSDSPNHGTKEVVTHASPASMPAGAAMGPPNGNMLS